MVNITEPSLIKNEVSLPIKIVSNGTFDGKQVLKNSIKEQLGNNNSFEFNGLGDRKIKVPIYLDNQASFEKIIDFLSDGKPFLISCPFFPLRPVNIEGDLDLKPYYKGHGTLTLNLTTAISPFQDTTNLFNYKITSNPPLDKATFLDSLRDFGESVLNFQIPNQDSKFANFSNNIAVYSSQINNIAQGIAGKSSIITNPISSIKNSASQIAGGISGVVNSLQNTVNVVKKLPSDVDNIINSFSQIGDQLNDLFDLDDPDATLQYSTELLQSVAEGIIESPVSDDNPDIPEETNKTKYFLVSPEDDNKAATDVLILSPILLSIYENTENIDKWNSIDLIRLRLKAETIYSFINGKELSTDFRNQLTIARNRFFDRFKILYGRAIKIVDVDLQTTKFLTDVVYSVNGNYDFLAETKELNRVVGTRVIGKISVISNE